MTRLAAEPPDELSEIDPDSLEALGDDGEGPSPVRIRIRSMPLSEVYEEEIMPRIRLMTVPQLMELTGLSQFHCWKVRKGERRLHARHWEAVKIATNGHEGG